MSHGRHAYNRAKRRGDFDRFRCFASEAELERLWDERGAIDADEREDELSDEWFGEELREIENCDAIYLLCGWEKSVGARRELMVALDHRLEICLQKEAK